MKNQLSTVTEVVVRSIFYIITNYVFVSMGLSFHTHWIAILFLLSMVWATIDYGKSVNKITGKKVIAEIHVTTISLTRYGNNTLARMSTKNLFVNIEEVTVLEETNFESMTLMFIILEILFAKLVEYRTKFYIE